MSNSEIDAFLVLADVDVKVGKCSTQELMGILNPCMRQFYMKYREDANTDCLSNYTRMRGCVKQQVKQCFVGVEVKNDLGENVAEAIVNESLPLEDAMKFCDRSDADAALPVEEGSVQYCSSDFYIQSASLTKEFNSVYNEDRGSLSLCQEYESYGEAILQLSKQHCRPSLYRFMKNQMDWAESKQLNPFCSDEQVRQGC